MVLPYFILKHGLTGSKRNKVVIIFDGYPRTPELVKSPADNMEIIFSRKVSADETIKRLLEKAAGVKDIVVVSDDKEIIGFSRLIGARPLSVKDFIRRKDKLDLFRTRELKPELTYTQMHKINQELRKIWLE